MLMNSVNRGTLMLRADIVSCFYGRVEVYRCTGAPCAPMMVGQQDTLTVQNRLDLSLQPLSSGLGLHLVDVFRSLCDLNYLLE